jgi:Lon protease-like protein
MQEVVMRKTLPARPSVEHLKSQAKDLLASVRDGDREALSRFRDNLPAAKGLDDAAIAALALHDAQSAIAREYGFASWNELKVHVESVPSPETIRAMAALHPSAPVPAQVVEALVSVTADMRTESIELPPRLPLLPMRNALLSAGTAVPVNVGRVSSLAAVAAAQKTDSLLAVFSQKDVMQSSPSFDDLHPVGCAVRIAAVVPYDGGQWVVVQALRWIRLEAIESGSVIYARVGPFAVEGAGDDLGDREARLRERVRTIATGLADGERIVRLTERMTAAELADVTLANLPCSVDDKARYAAEPSLAARLDFVLALLDRAA